MNTTTTSTTGARKCTTPSALNGTMSSFGGAVDSVFGVEGTGSVGRGAVAAGVGVLSPETVCGPVAGTVAGAVTGGAAGAAGAAFAAAGAAGLGAAAAAFALASALAFS